MQELTVIRAVAARSPAARAGVRPGERLLAVNGHPIADVLDYKFHTYDPRLALTLAGPDGTQRQLTVRKGEGEDLGLEFPDDLMDKTRSCANRCVFCFVDQLPPGMRETLYFKDDDARLSFLMGNYITLTNLSAREARRIIDLRISPINISVHATDPALRAMMLGHRGAGRGLDLMREFSEAGITMNCQIVACPGLNDGSALQRSLDDLAALHPGVKSVSVVPVGLTKWRDGLHPLRPYSRAAAADTVALVEEAGRGFLARLGTTMAWCSDEFYLRAELPIPADAYYEEYTQLENGVGMLRLLRTEFESALRLEDEGESGLPPFSVACGVDAAPWLAEMIDMAGAKCHTKGAVYPIVNDFFGHTITVSGLITGGDLIGQLRGKDLGARLLLPATMLRHGEDVFLDNVKVGQVERALGVPVRLVRQDGFDLLDAMLDRRES